MANKIIIPETLITPSKQRITLDNNLQTESYKKLLSNHSYDYVADINKSGKRDLAEVTLGEDWFLTLQPLGNLYIKPTKIRKFNLTLSEFPYTKTGDKASKPTPLPKSIDIDSLTGTVGFRLENYEYGEKPNFYWKVKNPQGVKNISIKSNQNEVVVKNINSVEKVNITEYHNIKEDLGSYLYSGRTHISIDNCPNLKELTISGFELLYYHQLKLKNLPNDCILNLDKNLKISGSFTNPSSEHEFKHIIYDNFQGYEGSTTVSIKELFKDKVKPDDKFVHITYKDFKKVIYDFATKQLKDLWEQSQKYEQDQINEDIALKAKTNIQRKQKEKSL